MQLQALGLLALLTSFSTWAQARPAQARPAQARPAAAPVKPALVAKVEAAAETPTKPKPKRGETEGLRYLVILHLRGEEKPWETRFTVVPTPPVKSHNKVKKPRLGGWKLEADRAQGTPNAHSFLLARAERLLFLSGILPQADPEPFVLRFASRSCPVWRVQVPKGVKATAYLAEVGPGLLALCDLSAKFDKGDIKTIELHLEGIGLKAGTAPPEDGTSLLTTLQRWYATGSAGEGPAGGGGNEGVN
jgi:hypothetical protein